MQARQTACWMSRQIQANSRGDRDGAATTSAKRTKFSGICRGRKRTPLESVTVRPLPANTVGLQTMEQISPRPSRLENLPVYILRDPFPKPLNLGSTRILAAITGGRKTVWPRETMSIVAYISTALRALRPAYGRPQRAQRSKRGRRPHLLVSYLRRAIIQCRLLFCVHNFSTCRRHVTNRAEPAGQVNLRHSVYIMYPLYLYSTCSGCRARRCLVRGRFCYSACYQHGCYIVLQAWMLQAWMLQDAPYRGTERRGYGVGGNAKGPAETAEQRAHRLWQRRERDRARRALQSSERRERERESCSVCALPVMTD